MYIHIYMYIYVASLEDVFLKCLCCWWPLSHGGNSTNTNMNANTNTNSNTNTNTNTITNDWPVFSRRCSRGSKTGPTSQCHCWRCVRRMGYQVSKIHKYKYKKLNIIAPSILIFFCFFVTSFELSINWWRSRENKVSFFVVYCFPTLLLSSPNSCRTTNTKTKIWLHKYKYSNKDANTNVFRLLKKAATRFQEKERRILCCCSPTLIVSPPNSCGTTKGLILFRQKSDSRNMKLSGAD